MLRAELNGALKEAMKARDARRIATLRLILAAIKDRDIAARGTGAAEGVGDAEIIDILSRMIRQRRDGIAAYAEAERTDLVSQEEAEIAIIESYLPRQLSEDEIRKASGDVVSELGAQGLRDMGRVMGVLKERYQGRMDFSKAGAAVKELLS